MIRLLLVEDNTLMRTALAEALPADDLAVVGAVATAQEASTIAETERVDVLLADLDLGDGPNGLVLAHALRLRDPNLGVVILTSYEDPRAVGTKMPQLPPGAEYVAKQTVSDVGALRTVIARAALRGAGSPLEPARELPRSHFTDTQLETMRLIAEGRTNAEIAQDRVVAEKTVEITISRILRILNETGHDAGNPRVRITRAYYALTGADAIRRPSS